jgi:hypothetical protein
MCISFLSLGVDDFNRERDASDSCMVEDGEIMAIILADLVDGWCKI